MISWKSMVCSVGRNSLFLGAGLVLGALACFLLLRGTGVPAESDGAGGGAPWGLALRQAHADLKGGEYEFFPNRRSIWIVNRTNGRMAHYLFRDDELGSIDRSRVTSIDLKSFPRQDTAIHLSDRNLVDILWVCNVRTGDVQMWHVGRDGLLRAEGPITSNTDLMDRSQ